VPASAALHNTPAMPKTTNFPPILIPYLVTAQKRGGIIQKWQEQLPGVAQNFFGN
jgi:hypothetical protein